MTAAYEFDSKLDTEYLSDFYENDFDHIEMAFEMFVKSIRQQKVDLSLSFELNDMDGVRKKIHKMKPALAFVGLTNLKNKVEQIEKGCLESSGNPSFTNLFNGFIIELDEMIPVIENELSRISEFAKSV